jgi:glycosyltransferase involved in cell wall biosynthesis
VPLSKNKTILTFIGHYLPGYKAGGAIRTIANMVNFLSDQFQFKIITQDRDLIENEPYKNVKINSWNLFEKCEVFYSDLKLSLKQIINNTAFDIYYLNSLFDFHFSIKVVLLRKFKLIPQKELVLAPRGELMKGALSVKPLKKRIYILISKILNIYSDVTWQASNENEVADIKREYGENINVRTALDIPDFNLKKTKQKKEKTKDHLRILFISVISPKKNLLFVIETLNKVQGNFTLDIYGPVKDEQYWQECKDLIDPRIKDKIFYKGEVHHDRVHEIYPNYDLFFFPTMGESFGHVIYESLYFGCPVLCSDTTPWNELEKFNAGWNFQLNRSKKFSDLIEMLISLEPCDYAKYDKGGEKYLEFFTNGKDIIQNHLRLFHIYQKV